jgi:hypothetical protein
MINEDNKFQAYANTLVREVPTEDVAYLVALFMKEASINMGVDSDSQTLERVIYYVKKEYSYIPINFIASAFVKGSLGKIGDGRGRLVPKTIHTWLGDASLDYNRMIASLKEKQKLNDVSIAMNLQKYPAGSAIVKKIEWYRKGILNLDDWDKIPLKELAEKINAGIFVTPELFGLKLET